MQEEFREGAEVEGQEATSKDGPITEAREGANALFGRAQDSLSDSHIEDQSGDLISSDERPVVDGDRIEGAAKTFGGRIEGSVGELVGDRKLQSDGAWAVAKGTAQNLAGGAQDAIRAALQDAPPEVRDGAERAMAAARKNPLIATLAVGAIGLILAKVLRGGSNAQSDAGNRHSG